MLQNLSNSNAPKGITRTPKDSMPTVKLVTVFEPLPGDPYSRILKLECTDCGAQFPTSQYHKCNAKEET